MAQEVYVLPVRCMGCNAIFDLWYDLQKQERGGWIAFVGCQKVRPLSNQSLCWKCRQDALVKEVEDSSSNKSDEEGESQKDGFALEDYELFLGYSK